MYIDSVNVENRKQCDRLLRSEDKYIFKVDGKIGTEYRRSPYYMGTLLWNELPAGTQFASNMIRVKQFCAP